MKLSLVGPLSITCWACGEQLSIQVRDISTVHYQDGRIEITPHIDHASLAAHFATHNTEPKGLSDE